MKKAVQICGLALAMCLAPMAFAQTSVTLTGVSGQSYDGIYVSPYYANVGGTSTAVVCDDFADESTLGSTWSAQTTSFSNANSTNTNWGLAGKDTSLYGAVGYLANQLLSASGQQQIIDTFALWAVFDPSGVEQYLAAHPITSGPLTTAQLCSAIFGTSSCSSSTPLKNSLLWMAENSNFTAAQWGMTVLSADIPGTNKLCTAESGNCPAQEFIYLSVAEGGAAAAYLVLAGFCCWGAIFLSSKRRLATRIVA